MKFLTYFLNLAMLSFNATDLITTLIGLSMGARELDPYFSIGFIPFFLIKILFPTLVAIFYAFIAEKYPRHERIVQLTIMGLLLVFAYATINNLFVLRSIWAQKF